MRFLGTEAGQDSIVARYIFCGAWSNLKRALNQYPKMHLLSFLFGHRGFPPWDTNSLALAPLLEHEVLGVIAVATVHSPASAVNETVAAEVIFVLTDQLVAYKHKTTNASCANTFD